MTVDELGRSLRGTAALINREPGALDRFEISGRAFWRSFGAIGLTAPAFTVELALLRHRLGMAPVDGPFADGALVALTAAGHLAGFLALPVATAFLAARAGLGGRYVPFTIVSNWVTALASFGLALPGALLLLGLETPALATLFEVAFVVIALSVHARATRATLGIDVATSAAITGLGLLLMSVAVATVQALAPAIAGFSAPG